MYHLAELAVKIAQRTESGRFGNVKNGSVGVGQEFTGFCDVDTVEIMQRTDPHHFLKNSSEMRQTDVAEVCQCFHGELIHVMVLDIIQSGATRRMLLPAVRRVSFSIAVGTGCLLWKRIISVNRVNR